MKIFTILPGFLALLYWSSNALANSIREIQPLDFGSFTMIDSGAHSLVVSTDGTTSNFDAGIHKMRNGHFAIFEISGMDPAALFYVTIDPATLTHASGSPVLTVDNFTFDPPNDSVNTIHTDSGNNLRINVGATMHTPGGTPIKTGPYRGTYNFMINF